MQQFHVFLGANGPKGYYLKYKGETDLISVINTVIDDPELPKLLTPAIVLNRFYYIDTAFGKTVKNRYDNLQSTTGYFVLDIDHMEINAKFVRQVLSENDEIFMSWISSSKLGVKAIGYSPDLSNTDVVTFKKRYAELCDKIRKHSGLFLNFDPMLGRPHQPVFLNSDPSAIVNYKHIPNEINKQRKVKKA